MSLETGRRSRLLWARRPAADLDEETTSNWFCHTIRSAWHRDFMPFLTNTGVDDFVKNLSVVSFDWEASFFAAKGGYQIRQHRTIWQEAPAWIFGSIQSLENEGILYVFLVFQTEDVGQKGGCGSQTQLCSVALMPLWAQIFSPFKRRTPWLFPKIGYNNTVPNQIEDLCNGSTPDSDSVCGGSNPSSSAKQQPNFVYRTELGCYWYIDKCFRFLFKELGFL